jgi:hypothetical protein
MFRSSTIVGSVCAILLVAGAAQAANLEIQIAGVDLVYDGQNLYDAGGAAGGAGNPAQADPLIGIGFLLDGILQGVLWQDVYIDFYLANLTNIPVGGGTVTSGGNGDAFGLDLLTSSVAPGYGLGLNLDEFAFWYSGSELFIATGGTASSLSTQNLPFGLSFDTPIDEIKIVLSSANLSNVTDDGTFLTGFTSSGTGNLAGEGTPEPATLALLALGGLMYFRRPRHA